MENANNRYSQRTVVPRVNLVVVVAVVVLMLKALVLRTFMLMAMMV